MPKNNDKKSTSSSIRFPPKLWVDIRSSAEKNMRSTNSEVVIRLQRSLESDQQSAA